ncbi:MAG: sulfate adenylyltransferase subunit 1 [Burkholderiaceae bacterium]
MDVLRVVTSGSVDDGKSTLIGRLLHDAGQISDDILQAVTETSQKRGLDFIDLSLLTDGLLAEREQGITIDVAYRYFQTPERKYIIADCPGHRQYTRNMVTGASNADIAILLVDAARGLSEQTLRHAAVCGWLQVPHVVLAVNKLDRIDWSQSAFAEIEQQFRQWCEPMGIKRVDAIPMSALDGDMVVHRGSKLDWYTGKTLLETLSEAATSQSDASPVDHAALSVQTINRSNPKTFDGVFRGYGGRVNGGILSVGDQITVLPAGHKANVSELRIGSKEVPFASAGSSVLVRLDRDLDISRGDVLVRGGDIVVADSARAELAWFSAEPLKAGQCFDLKIGAQTIQAEVDTIVARLDLDHLQPKDAEQVNVDDLATVDFRFDESVSLAVNDCRTPLGRFILIDQQTGATVGAGKVREVSTDGGALSVRVPGQTSTGDTLR